MLRSRVFGQVADVYDRVRPEYPTQLVDDVLGYADGAPAPALEIGAGTGKATAAFAARSLPVTALEPDPAMAAVLRRQVAGVTVVVSSFEEYEPPHRFGLVFCADATMSMLCMIHSCPRRVSLCGRPDLVNKS